MRQAAEQQQYTKRQRYCVCLEVCFWSYHLLVIALALAIMGKVIVAYDIGQAVKDSDYYKHAEESVSLWERGYIIDIKVERTNNCPEGYQPLINYKWHGTVQGCYCSSNSNGYNFDFVLEGKCSSELISYGCDSIDPVQAKTLNMWKGTSLLCYKRANQINFYHSTMTDAPSGGTSTSMTSCSTGENYEVYTLPDVPCPVSTLSNTSIGSSQTTLTLESANSYVLNFMAQSNYPIADIKLTQHAFCKFFADENISPNKQGTYILETERQTQSCSQTDDRMVTVDSLNEQDFFTNNTRVYQLINQLPAYPQPSVDYNYLLGFIRYPSWSYACRSSEHFSLAQTTDHLLFQESEQAVKAVTGVVIPCALILALLLRLFFIARHLCDVRNKSAFNVLNVDDQQIQEQMPNLDIRHSYNKECFIFTIELIILAAMLGTLCYATQMLTEDSRWIKDILKNQCTDTHLESIFTYYQDNIDEMSHLYTQAALLQCVLVSLYIIYFCVRNKTGDLYSKQDDKPQISIASQSDRAADVLSKQGRIEQNGMDSSELNLNKKDSNASQLQIFDMDYLMGQGGQTKDNFYGSLDRQSSIGVVSKKKKKKTNRNKKNLFRDK